MTTIKAALVIKEVPRYCTKLESNSAHAHRRIIWYIHFAL